MSLVVGQGVLDWVAPRAVGPHFSFGMPSTGIGWQKDGEIVAGVAYTNFNGRSVDLHMALESAKVGTRQFLWTVFDYPFNQLKVERLTGFQPQGNKEARNLVERLGFVLETTLKDAHPSGDMLVFVMPRHQCRWINEALYRRSFAKAA